MIDDGYTVVSRAARVNPEYGGKGLYRFLDNHVTEWIRYQQASVKAFTALGFNSNILKPSFRTHNRRILTQVDMQICYRVYLFVLIDYREIIH